MSFRAKARESLLNPADIKVVVADVDDLQRRLYPEEDAAISAASPVRRREFTAGRTVARIALQELGVAAPAIPVGEDRVPIWPAEVVGSISHTRTLAGAAVVSSHRCSGVGLDIEQRVAVTPDIYDRVMTAEEMAYVEERGDSEIPTVFFACKEAVYKAVYPIVEEFLDFCDVDVTLTDFEFTARCRNERASAPRIRVGRGQFEVRDEIVMALFWIPSVT